MRPLPVIYEPKSWTVQKLKFNSISFCKPQLLTNSKFWVRLSFYISWSLFYRHTLSFNHSWHSFMLKSHYCKLTNCMSTHLSHLKKLLPWWAQRWCRTWSRSCRRCTAGTFLEATDTESCRWRSSRCSAGLILSLGVAESGKRRTLRPRWPRWRRRNRATSSSRRWRIEICRSRSRNVCGKWWPSGCWSPASWSL